MSRTIIGLDLAQGYSQISYYNERNGEVESVSMHKNKENYLIPTPKELFETSQDAMDLGIVMLSNFIKACISFIKPVPEPSGICMMITMREIQRPWIGNLKKACEMIGIPADQVLMQSYKESFQCYVLNQKKDVWNQSVALFEYDYDRINAQILKIDRSMKPALVTIEDRHSQKLGFKEGLTDQQWNEKRDQLFLEQIKTVFQNEKISSCFLIGENFDKEWAIDSLQLLCKRRHVFLGQNLYAKGACYGMCKRLGAGKALNDFLYRSEDLVEVNLSMQLQIHGKESRYILINAGRNWFDSRHTFEIILGTENKLSFIVKSMMGGDPDVYSITLTGLPERPERTTRIRIEAEYQDAKHCKITVRDMGFGELFPSSNLVWTSVLNVG